MPRSPEPRDLARLRVATDPRLSPDGRLAAFTVQTAARSLDGYRRAIWLVPTDGSAPARQLTIGAKSDRHPRWAPDGRSLAFLSDRRLLVEEDSAAPKDREDGTQVHLLPLDGGEARRLTDLPRGVDGFAWSPDGRRLVVLTASVAATRAEDDRIRGKVRPRPGDLPEPDYRYIDRLGYQENGRGFTYGKVQHLWLVDVETGTARRLTDGPAPDRQPAWSPDGTRIAYVTNRRPDHDLRWRSDVRVLDLATGRDTVVTPGPAPMFESPAWLPDGSALAVLGGQYPDAVYGADIWLVAADGSDARPGGGRNLSRAHDLMPGSAMNSDVTTGEEARLLPSADGRWVAFSAPRDGAYELWRVSTADGSLERLTDGRHYLSGWDRVDAPDGERTVALRSSPTQPPDLVRVEADGGLAPLTALSEELLGEVELREPVERRWQVDGRQIQGWLLPAGSGPGPLVVEIHGGPHSLYGWSPVWEFQVLAGTGISVLYTNPRGSEGYGRAFNEANRGDWGPGPMRDVLAGVDAVVADGLADPARLGVTGGSYGGYLTNWIVAHDHRFRAAITCRSVSDMHLLFATGDISGGQWAEAEFGRSPWDDPAYFREISPLTYAREIRTPVLVQHSEKDIRTTIGQAEALFTVLRSLRRPVRMMRVPEENHELTRSGTPFRRIENLVQIRDWFRHYLVDGKRGLPPIPKARAEK